MQIKNFWAAFFIALIGLVFSYLWAGTTGLITTFLLVILEVTLSFDNAVVNASVLTHMSAHWQRRFRRFGW